MPTSRDPVAEGVRDAALIKYTLRRALATIVGLIPDAPPQAPPRSERRERWQPQPTDDWDDPR